MSFNWSEYLWLANALLSDPNSPGPEEASFRSAISRAYYAAFCSARNFGRDRREFVPQRDARDHWLVINTFSNSYDRDRRKIGLDLDRLYTHRCLADYEDFLRDPGSTAKASVETARKVISGLKSLS